jgi:putative membrane protein
MKSILTLQAIYAFLLYFVTGLGLTALFTCAYVAITPFNEFEQIREGKVGPAYTLSGAMLGFTFPLLSASYHGISFTEFLVWGIITGIVQVATFWAFYLVFSRDGVTWARMMDDRNAGAAIFYGALSIVIGLFNAFSLIP